MSNGSPITFSILQPLWLLANLIGCYYGRRPQKFQQDTVLQRSRMYGYRRADLAVTRFYTSAGIRHAMSQMEEFDVALRSAIEAGGNRAVQFIQRAHDGSIIPCSPNKILVATTQTLRPYKRILPIGFQTRTPRTSSSAAARLSPPTRLLSRQRQPRHQEMPLRRGPQQPSSSQLTLECLHCE